MPHTTVAWSRMTAQIGVARALLPFAAVAAAAGLVFAVLCDAVGEHDGLTVVDRPVALWVAAHRTLVEGDVALLLAKVTSPAVLVAAVAVAVLLLAWRGRRREALVLGASVVLAYALGGAAKYGEHRARPAAPINLAPETEPSFPSGHVLVITTVAFVALLLAWRHLGRRARVAGVLLAAAASTVVGVDRLVAGAHWLTDVVGALALAVVVVALAAAAHAWLLARDAAPSAPPGD
ncbi:MAG: phosphatase PAP2 family protein [Frankiales bacterium]|nr:phosphatase PAP2 family protein [Frankiales bacterium]